MNRKIKAIIEFVNVHKKETIGVAVALGIAVIGVSGYVISNHYTNKNTNNVALAGKKENPKTDEVKKVEENKTSDNEEVTVEEQEDGALVVKDKDGNTIADSSKGDDVSKVVEKKKEAGSNVNIKNKKGEVEKVESVDNGTIKVASGETISSKTENKVQFSQKQEQVKGEKVEKVENIKGTTASSEGSITIVKPSKEESSSEPESKPQEQPEEQKPEEAPQPSQKPEPEEQSESIKPVEKPQEEQLRPVESVQYMDAMTQQLWSEYNTYRQSLGLNPLKWSDKYAEWTKNHAEEMAKNNTGSYHKSYPEGGQVVGNNSSKNLSASKILQQFKNSPKHNQNITEADLTEGACAVYKSSDGDYYFTIGFDY